MKLKNLLKEVSDAAYTIHRFTDCGQNAAQDFIDDNKIDGEKLVKFLKRTDNEGLRNRYMVRDIIGGKTDNNTKQKFVKLFKESIVKEGLDPKAQRFLDAIQVIDRDIKDLKNITVDATPQGNWSVYFKGKRMGTINGKILDDSTIMKYGLEESVSKSINEASEIKIDELDSAKQKQVQQFVKFFGGKVLQIWDGIHGNIVDIKMSDSNWRMDTQDLKDLISLKIRWIEFDKQTVSIGF